MELLQFPTIIPSNNKNINNEQEYNGYLPVHNTDYFIRFRKTRTGFRLLEISPALDVQNKTLTNCSSIVNFLENLKTSILAKQPSHDVRDSYHVCFYQTILNEFFELREFYINLYSCVFTPDLQQINIQHRDECDRIHNLTIKAQPGDLTRIFKVTDHSLPEDKTEKATMFQGGSSLKVLFDKFLQYIDALQPYFVTMENIDLHCHILDPQKPTFKDNYRRIALDTHLSMIVTLDPWNLTTKIPDIKFLGPDRLTEAFRQKLIENYPNWTTNSDILEQLLQLLEIPQFPPRPQRSLSTPDDSKVLYNAESECCICFSLRLNDKLPEILCQNTSCEQKFHTECLWQWLTSIGAKQSFNELHGQCPNCEKNISCPL